MEALYSTTAISSGDGREGRAALADGSLELAMTAPAQSGGKGGSRKGSGSGRSTGA